MNIFAKLILAAPLALALAAAGCTKTDEPQGKKPETVREQAEAVGKLGDRTVTTGLEKGLTNVVDKSAEEAQRLKDANAASNE